VAVVSLSALAFVLTGAPWLHLIAFWATYPLSMIAGLAAWLILGSASGPVDAELRFVIIPVMFVSAVVEASIVVLLLKVLMAASRCCLKVLVAARRCCRDRRVTRMQAA
jgi:hypothetical protein